MIHSIIKDRPTRLFIILGSFFVANTLIAEIIGVKLFSLEKTLQLPASNISLLGESGLGFTLTVGVLIWPVVFIMTDLINEYYGVRGGKVFVVAYCNDYWICLYCFLWGYPCGC
jgi:queuosine precursor transporter